MNQSLDIRKEINPALDTASPEVLGATETDLRGLPPLSCGWIEREYHVSSGTLKLMVPGQPDMLLDDPAVRAANDQDDYMPYWAYLWPAAIHMAHAIAQAPWTPGTQVLELGCGVGLVGLAALAAGCHVSLTDYDPMAVSVAKHNAERNGFRTFDAFQLDWRTPPEKKYPVIVGCDVTYELRNHLPILNLLDCCLAADGVCWLGDGGRRVSGEFCDFARTRGYSVIIRDAEGVELPTPGFHYQLFELRCTNTRQN